jgi:spermidine synthase
MSSHLTQSAENDQNGENADSTRSVLILLFIASGAAGLIYESLWTRYLGMFVGHTAYAQIVVLAIFLGGMSWGALLISSRSERLQDPLAWYARVELLIGLIGFVFHPIFNIVTHSV